MEVWKVSVLVRGMEMPKSCSVCREIYYVPDSVKGTSVRCGIDNKLIHQYSKTVYDIKRGFPYQADRPDWCPLVEVVRTGEGLYDTYTPLDKETAKHVTEVFRKSTERMETEE